MKLDRDGRRKHWQVLQTGEVFMLYTGFFKRIIPFVLTFAVGLLVASLFVTVALPSFGSGRDGRRARRFQDRQQLLMEIDKLKDELRDARLENESLRQNAMDRNWNLEEAVPPVDSEEHHPPAPPKRPKHPRFDQ